MTSTDRYRTTDEGDGLLPAAETPLVDPAQGGYPVFEIIVLDDADLTATDEEELAKAIGEGRRGELSISCSGSMIYAAVFQLIPAYSEMKTQTSRSF